jgi:hypothetical protein
MNNYKIIYFEIFYIIVVWYSRGSFMFKTTLFENEEKQLLLILKFHKNFKLKISLKEKVKFNVKSRGKKTFLLRYCLAREFLFFLFL